MMDLRSDTVSQPGPGMRAAMAAAEVGDDVYGDDPTVNALQARVAGMLGKEDALFVPSGTQSNLIGILNHCGRGDEYIVAQMAHTYRLEGGGAATLGGIQPQPLNVGDDGTMDLDEVAANIKPDDVHYARTRLLCIENTYKGMALDLAYIHDARKLVDAHGINLHLDGARFFNATTAKQISFRDLADPFDSVSICLSKGLGAPIGSVLVGSKAFIREGRRWRKMLGGGMRQAGILAAAGLYALENHIERLAIDHSRAERVAGVFAERFGSGSVSHATNMVHTALDADEYERLRLHLLEQDINASRTRWVFHLDQSDADVDRLCSAVHTFK